MGDRAIRRSLASWLMLSPLIVVILFPFAVMVTTAIKPRAEILAVPPTWLPTEIRWMNLVEMWQEENDVVSVPGPAVVGIGLRQDTQESIGKLDGLEAMVGDETEPGVVGGPERLLGTFGAGKSLGTACLQVV